MTEESNFRKGVEELKKAYKEEFKKRKEFLDKIKSLARKQKLNQYLSEMESMLAGLSDSAMQQILDDLKLETEIENSKTEDLLRQFKREIRNTNPSNPPTKTLGEIEDPEESQNQESPQNQAPKKTLGDNEF